jgi:hypothetical protein
MEGNKSETFGLARLFLAVHVFESALAARIRLTGEHSAADVAWLDERLLRLGN